MQENKLLRQQLLLEKFQDERVEGVEKQLEKQEEEVLPVGAGRNGDID